MLILVINPVILYIDCERDCENIGSLLFYKELELDVWRKLASQVNFIEGEHAVAQCRFYIEM